MTEGTLRDKVYFSYIEEFGAMRNLEDVQNLKIVVKGAFGYVQFYEKRYYCRLTSKGVKKHSWRMD